MLILTRKSTAAVISLQFCLMAPPTNAQTTSAARVASAGQANSVSEKIFEHENVQVFLQNQYTRKVGKEMYAQVLYSYPESRKADGVTYRSMVAHVRMRCGESTMWTYKGVFYASPNGTGKPVTSVELGANEIAYKTPPSGSAGRAALDAVCNPAAVATQSTDTSKSASNVAVNMSPRSKLLLSCTAAAAWIKTYALMTSPQEQKADWDRRYQKARAYLHQSAISEGIDASKLDAAVERRVEEYVMAQAKEIVDRQRAQEGNKPAPAKEMEHPALAQARECRTAGLLAKE